MKIPTVLCVLANCRLLTTAPISTISPSFSSSPNATSSARSNQTNRVSIAASKSSPNHRKTLPLLSIEIVKSEEISSSKINLELTIAGMLPTNTFSLAPCSTNCLGANETNRNSSMIVHKRHKHRNLFALIIGVLSLLGLVANFVFMTRICSCDGVPVIVLFGICLMLFNIILSVYGVALAGYLYKGPTLWNDRFCQGFTSIKLFGLGSGVWTLIMLTFHESIKESTEDEREAVFKGIVYVLEGVMLSGVMAVMAWIKLDSWTYLCSILEPRTAVEWLLTGIELWYYFIALMLVIRYPIRLLKSLKKKDEEEKKGRNEGNTIFTFILICFLLWGVGYALTIPQVGVFGTEVSSVIRVSVLMFVLLIQPFLYAMARRNKYLPCSRKSKKDRVEEVLLVCECTGSETCAACDSEFDSRVRYGVTRFTEPETDPGASSDEQLDKDLEKKNLKRRKKQKVEETKEMIKKNKKRKSKGKVASPKAICRSPEIRLTLDRTSVTSDGVKEEENVPLLNKEPEEETKQNSQLKPSKEKEGENVPLLDDMDGKPAAPKAFVDASPAKALESPSRSRQSEFPSFINLKTAVNVDELPKERKPKFLELSAGESPTSDAPRVSRGPTFYQISEKEKLENKTVVSSSQEKNREDEITVKDEISKSSSVKKEKRKRRKRSAERKDKESKSGQEKKLSTHSLEWDYSDSSGSTSDDKVPAAETPVHPTGQGTKDHMEWDPSGCSIKAPENMSPTSEWEPYATDEARSCSVTNAMSKPTAHLSKDVSFDNGLDETNNHNHKNEESETKPAENQTPKEKGKKSKNKKQMNGKVKKSKKKEKRKEEKANS